MGKTLADLVIDLSANTERLRADMDKATTHITKYEKQVKKSNENSAKSFQNFAKGAAAIAFLGFARDVVQAAGAKQTAYAQLDQVLVSMGRDVQKVGATMKTAADEMQEMGVAASTTTIEAGKMLATFPQISDEIMPRAIAVMTDMAALTGGDMTAAALTLGKASEGLTGVLSRMGISLSDASKETKDFNLILRDIESQVKGQQAAIRDTGFGGMTAWSVQIGNLKEELGGPLLDSIAWAHGKLTDFFSAAGTQFATTVEGASLGPDPANMGMTDTALQRFASRVGDMVHTGEDLMKVWELVSGSQTRLEKTMQPVNAQLRIQLGWLGDFENAYDFFLAALKKVGITEEDYNKTLEDRARVVALAKKAEIDRLTSVGEAFNITIGKGTFKDDEATAKFEANLQKKVDKLMASLQTQEDQIETWYEGRLDQLDIAVQNELITWGAYVDAVGVLLQQVDKKREKLNKDIVDSQKRMWEEVGAGFATSMSSAFVQIGREAEDFAEIMETTVVSAIENVIESLIEMRFREAILGTEDKKGFNLGAFIGALATGGAGAALIAGLSGNLHGGIDSVPREGSYTLQKGEAVLTPEAASSLSRMLEGADGGNLGGGTVINNDNRMTFNGVMSQHPEFVESLREIIRETDIYEERMGAS